LRIRYTRDAQLAREFGAKDIGLTRTEHMFFEDKKIIAMREMILADSVSVEDIKRRVDSLAENNPMLGHRGCRLGITFPEITAADPFFVSKNAFDVLETKTSHNMR